MLTKVDNRDKTVILAKNWLKDNKVNVVGLTAQNPDISSIKNLCGRSEKACASKKAYKPVLFTPVMPGGMGQNPSTI